MGLLAQRVVFIQFSMGSHECHSEAHTVMSNLLPWFFYFNFLNFIFSFKSFRRVMLPLYFMRCYSLYSTVDSIVWKQVLLWSDNTTCFSSSALIKSIKSKPQRDRARLIAAHNGDWRMPREEIRINRMCVSSQQHKLLSS